MPANFWDADAVALPAAPPKKGGASSAPVTATDEAMETATDRDKARSAIDLIARIQPRLDRVRELYQSKMKGVGPVHSLMEYLPTQSNGQFDTAVSQLRTLVRPATRTVGEGSMSDFESKLALQGLPDRWSFDGTNEEALKGLQDFLDTSKAAFSKRAGLPAPPPVARKPKPAGEFTLDAQGNIVR